MVLELATLCPQQHYLW